MTAYPPWVKGPKGTPIEVQRRNVLTFIVRQAALQIDGTASYRALADSLGYRHSTFCAYIERGRFSRDLALAIEQRVGRKFAPHELLMNPLIGIK